MAAVAGLTSAVQAGPTVLPGWRTSASLSHSRRCRQSTIPSLFNLSAEPLSISLEGEPDAPRQVRRDEAAQQVQRRRLPGAGAADNEVGEPGRHREHPDLPPVDERPRQGRADDDRRTQTEEEPPPGAGERPHSEALAILEDHIATAMTRYRGVVDVWDVVNEALNDNSPSNFRTDSALYTKSGNSAVYIEKAFQAARAADAVVFVGGLTGVYSSWIVPRSSSCASKWRRICSDCKACPRSISSA